MTSIDSRYLENAYNLARRSYEEGGIPIGSILVSGDKVIGAGYNRRVQDGEPHCARRNGCHKKGGTPKELHPNNIIHVAIPVHDVCGYDSAVWNPPRSNWRK